MKKVLLRHINSGKVKEMTEDHARDFMRSPSWEMIDSKGNRIAWPAKKRPLNPVQAPPVFEKPKKTKSA